MKRSRTVFKIAGIAIQLNRSWFIGCLILALFLLGLAWVWLPLPTGARLVFTAVAFCLHWASELTHQLGHAWVAKRLGYPMERIRAWYLLAAGLYPANEPALPAETHIKRALGGPVTSLLLGLAGSVVALGLRPLGGLAYYLALFFTFENLFFFCLGSLLPLPFTDGGTLRYWWPKRGQA